MAKTIKSALRGVRWGARHRSPTPPCDTFWDSSRGVLQRIIGLNACCAWCMEVKVEMYLKLSWCFIDTIYNYILDT